MRLRFNLRYFTREERFGRAAAKRYMLMINAPIDGERLSALLAARITRCTGCARLVEHVKNPGEKYTGNWVHCDTQSPLCPGANPRADWA